MSDGGLLTVKAGSSLPAGSHQITVTATSSTATNVKTTTGTTVVVDTSPDEWGTRLPVSTYTGSSGADVSFNLQATPNMTITITGNASQTGYVELFNMSGLEVKVWQVTKGSFCVRFKPDQDMRLGTVQMSSNGHVTDVNVYQNDKPKGSYTTFLHIGYNGAHIPTTGHDGSSEQKAVICSIWDGTPDPYMISVTTGGYKLSQDEFSEKIYRKVNGSYTESNATEMSTTQGLYMILITAATRATARFYMQIEAI